MNFEDDLKAALEAPLAARWKSDRKESFEVWVTLSPADAPTEVFVARLYWKTYPGSRPPSVKFVDPATGRLDVTKAWPQASGFRPTSFDICANWTDEGFTTHPEWVTTEHRWDSSGNVILRVMIILQTELDTTYTGRFHE